MRCRHELTACAFDRCATFLLATVLLVVAGVHCSFAQSLARSPQPLITQPVNSASTVVLTGNTRRVARNPANDRGAVSDGMVMPHLLLQLRRPAAQERALEALIDQLHDPQSPNYHHWLSPEQFGAQFGPAASDRQAVVAWLQQQGFTVNSVYPSGMVIDFSGTAGQVRAAFRTQIHFLNVNGATRYANVSDPAIPAALSPAVVGVVSLHNIPPRHYFKPKAQYTAGGFDYLVSPADLATIYNFNPVFNAGNTGQGQTIYLVEDTDLYSVDDWATFRSTFGLSGYTGASLTTIHPGGCADPWINGDEGEAILDAEWASAAAPSAAIVMATCSDLLTAVQNLVNLTPQPAIISTSYGECEADNGSTANAAFNSAYQQGVTEGTSIFVSAGDGAAAGCDDFDTAQVASSGIAVNGFGSTPYNVAVGGTDFSDGYSVTSSTYWSSSNTPTYGSALSYIPEMPWNNSCASQLLASVFGFITTYGDSGFCNSSTGEDIFLDIVGGSGGPSTIYSKPSWQSELLGNPSDGVRDLPDVSLFAANGVWGHYYVFCWSDPSESDSGAAPCTGAPSNWSGAGGTSFASPIWAGIQALINQNAGSAQGLPTVRLYQLAKQEYGASGSNSCNSSNGNGVGRSCIFYDVTLGDNDVPCAANSANCYAPSGIYGVLSTSTGSYAPAYTTQTGWDFATGIGTVNVANLVAGWSGSGHILTATHDFNADGKSDILWRDTGGDAAIWEMSGGTILGGVSLGNVPTNWSVVGTRDFNGDGFPDLLWRDTAGDVWIWLMGVSGSSVTVSQSSVLGNEPTAWSVAGTGDFNGDGKGDILWYDTSGNLKIWFMNGFAASEVPITNVPTIWSVAGVGDFNGDGKSDILWHDIYGDVSIWTMNGATIQAGSGLGNIPTNWSIAGTGDFNGDGTSDIVWRDTAGDVLIQLISNATLLQQSVLGNVATTWSITETGDFDGDGKNDILWLDTSGNVMIWFMNGFAPSVVNFGNVGTVWSVQGTNAD